MAKKVWGHAKVEDAGKNQARGPMQKRMLAGGAGESGSYPCQLLQAAGVFA